MKFFVLGTILLFASGTFTQSDILSIAGGDIVFGDDYYHQKHQHEKETLKRNKVQSRITHQQTGAKRTKLVETFDPNGNLLTHDYFDHKNKHIRSYSYVYDNQSRPIYYHYQLGTKSAWFRVAYDASGQLKRSRGYRANGKFFGREEFSRPDGKPLATTIWDKDSLTPYKRLDYEYYEDGSLKTIRYFFKSKLKYTWTYDCKAEGQLLEGKPKDTTTICINESTDEKGNRVIWKQELTKKGNLVKTKHVYENDTCLILTERYSPDDRLISQTTYFKDGGKLYLGYTKKGSVHATSEEIYNPNNQLIKKSSTYGKQFSNYWYSYEGELLKTSTFSNRWQTTLSEYSYTFFSE